MKKLFALLAVVLAVVSCQRDADDLNVAMGGEQEVMLTVSLPEATRADSAQGFDIANIASTDYTLRYILEIHYNGKVLREEPKYSDSSTVVFPVRLAPDKEYTFAIWADIVDEATKTNDFYTIENGLSNIVFTDWADNANSELRDAYTCTMTKMFNAGVDLSMSLTRPFAKIRVISTDIADVRKFGLNPTSVEVEYTKPMYTSFNAVTGANVSTTANFKHVVNLNDENYTYADFNTPEATLFADYILVPEDGTVQFTMDVKAYDKTNTLVSIKKTDFNTPIPVVANKLTTIKGDVLTTGGNVSVKVENGLEEFKTITIVDTAESLQEVIDKADDNTSVNIELGGNIVLNDILTASTSATRSNETAYGLIIPADKSVVLDLKGYTISQEKTCTDVHSMIQNNGNLTILDSSENKTGKISFKDNGQGDSAFHWGSYTLTNSGQLVVLSGTIENATAINTDGEVYHMYCAIQQSGGTTTIKGGNIINNTYRSVRTNRGNLVVEGGKFIGQIWMQPFEENTSISISNGEFQPSGADGSSVFVTNNEKNVVVSVTGGEFMTKIGCSDASKLAGVITGGFFTTTAKEGTNIQLLDDDSEWVAVEGETDLWTVGPKPVIAMIGEVGYTSLQKAVAAVEDGGTITLVANEVFTETNRYNNSGWWDGLGYSGDKSFTIDLNNYTISQSQDGILNDYLIWVKNDGAKGNTITLKNGTLDAGKTAYCAFATASSNKQKITINLENIELKGNNSNGAVAKIRGGAELNVKADAVINGLNNYVGIECVNSTTNIYEGAKIYQKGTSSSWGCLVGVSGNGTVNVYGGKGTSARGGFIAMTSGGTINVAGGEWIANVDGTYASDNKGILIAQSDKQYNAGAGDSIINVTGGTFKGGYNCYGNKVCDAQINIMGGNFNADPSSYLAEGCEAKEANGVWTVRVIPVAKIGNVEYETLEAAAAAAKAGDTIILNKDVTLSAELMIPAGVTLNGNGKQINGSIYAGGDLTFAGHTKVTAFSASYYDRVITIGEGACLEVTGGGRVSLAYGNTFNITGSIPSDNAKTADKTNIQPSLIIPGGISITGGNDATMNVTNAYVQIGSTSSKNNSANGTFNLNFENSIAEFTNQFTFAEPTSGKNPTFNVNIKDSVLTTSTKMCIAAPNSNVVIDNSTVTLGSYLRNSGTLTLNNGSVLTGSTIQFGENGGNDGTITVDNSSFTIVAGSTGSAFDGKGIGSITAQKGATVAVDYYKDMTINVDATSTFTGTDIYGNRKIHYVSEEMKLEPTNLDALGGATIVSNVWDKTTGKGVITFDRDLTTIGDKAFQRVTNATPSNWATSITLPASVTSIGDYAFAQCYSLTTITIPDGVTTIGQYAFQSCDAVTTVTIGSRVSTIGSGAFYNCYEITEVICKPTVAPALADKWVFNGVNATFIVPAAYIDAYKTADVWKDFTIVAE